MTDAYAYVRGYGGDIGEGGNAEQNVYDFLLSLALGLRLLYPHLRHFVALGGFVA